MCSSIRKFGLGSNRQNLLTFDISVTEPFIVLLIIIQAILLTVDAVPSVYVDPRAKGWGTSGIDYAMLGLFIVYT